jgi:nitroimidazol reductase NimA-like FMN-containing flavoprotein (pyridoxamine 5'-phosphate oxidase superfamily)
LAKNGSPYLVPLSFGYDGIFIYVHTAAVGKKIDYWETNGRICFEFERNVELRRNAKNACNWTFAFESVIGYGTISEVTDPAAKEHALNEIMRQYSGRAWSIETASAIKVRVWRITIASLTGKHSKPKNTS